MIIIPEDILRKIKRQAEEESPNEACGYLAGEDNTVKEIYPMTNLDKSSEHFSFDPSEQFKVLKEARKKNLGLIAVYHSHPSSPACLSEEDLRLANDPGVVYLIHSLLTGETRAFKIREKKVFPEKMVVKN